MLPVEWQKKVDEMIGVASKVYNQIDGMNSAVRELEEELEKEKLWCPAKVYTGTVTLTTGRACNGKFRIMVDDVAWAECTREKKVKSYSHIITLLSEMKSNLARILTPSPQGA